MVSHSFAAALQQMMIGCDTAGGTAMWDQMASDGSTRIHQK